MVRLWFRFESNVIHVYNEATYDRDNYLEATEVGANVNDSEDSKNEPLRRRAFWRGPKTECILIVFAMDFQSTVRP
jgi:hypothetical protein